MPMEAYALTEPSDRTCNPASKMRLLASEILDRTIKAHPDKCQRKTMPGAHFLPDGLHHHEQMTVKDCFTLLNMACNRCLHRNVNSKGQQRKFVFKDFETANIERSLKILLQDVERNYEFAKRYHKVFKRCEYFMNRSDVEHMVSLANDAESKIPVGAKKDGKESQVSVSKSSQPHPNPSPMVRHQIGQPPQKLTVGRPYDLRPHRPATTPNVGDIAARGGGGKFLNALKPGTPFLGMKKNVYVEARLPHLPPRPDRVGPRNNVGSLGVFNIGRPKTTPTVDGSELFLSDEVQNEFGPVMSVGVGTLAPAGKGAFSLGGGKTTDWFVLDDIVKTIIERTCRPANMRALWPDLFSQLEERTSRCPNFSPPSELFEKAYSLLESVSNENVKQHLPGCEVGLRCACPNRLIPGNILLPKEEAEMRRSLRFGVALVAALGGNLDIYFNVDPCRYLKRDAVWGKPMDAGEQALLVETAALGGNPEIFELARPATLDYRDKVKVAVCAALGGSSAVFEALEAPMMCDYCDQVRITAAAKIGGNLRIYRKCLSSFFLLDADAACLAELPDRFLREDKNGKVDAKRPIPEELVHGSGLVPKNDWFRRNPNATRSDVKHLTE